MTVHAMNPQVSTLSGASVGRGPSEHTLYVQVSPYLSFPDNQINSSQYCLPCLCNLCFEVFHF